MTVAVTGASGFLGVNLLRALLQQGKRVRALVWGNDDRDLAGLDVERVQGDIRDPASLRRAFEGVDVVYHLAALISITGGMNGRVREMNVGGARNVAAAARACGVRRLVHTSSVHAFRLDAPGDLPIDETSPRPDPRENAAYDCSKHEGELAVRDEIARGLDAVIVNPTAILGVHDYRPSRLGRLLLDLYHGALPSMVDGAFDFVDVRDVVSGLIAAEARGRTGENYLLPGNWATVGEFARTAGEITGKAPPKLTTPIWLARVGVPFAWAYGRATKTEPLFTMESLATLETRHRISGAKARRELGHVPRSLEETIRDTYEWFIEAGVLPAGAVRGASASTGVGAQGRGAEDARA